MTDAEAGGSSSGYELAKKALEEARARSRTRAATGKAPLSNPAGSRSRRRWSGAGPDHRDPQSLGSLVGRLSQAPGWQTRVGAATVLASWDAIVGADVCAHARPSRLEGASSTSLRSQRRGRRSCATCRVTSSRRSPRRSATASCDPAADHRTASAVMAKRPRHVPGRGPRDTYG